MEVENVASKGVANTALGLGIAGLGLTILEARRIQPIPQQ